MSDSHNSYTCSSENESNISLGIFLKALLPVCETALLQMSNCCLGVNFSKGIYSRA